MICERCHAGQMREYERKVGPNGMTTIRGTRCDICGFTLLEDDGDIWSAVGL
jgi:predicted HNH restriction endonuclease